MEYFLTFFAGVLFGAFALVVGIALSINKR